MFWFTEKSNHRETDRSSSTDDSHGFDDLAPVENADKDKSYKHYADALTYALNNDRIKNIAITGPYGSGKSSIIRTFEVKNRQYKFLNISLASFDERSKALKTPFTNSESTTIENRLIERSILQQMLYGADANNLPYSRFKRISTPKHPLLKSSLIVSLVLATFLLISKPELFKSDHILSLATLASVFLVTFIIITLVAIGASIYKSFYGVSFKKLSLKNAEFEIGSLSEDSILNRHLDEIIYFFQETEYDVVVIEDLDRFGSPEIFVKLREINKLINTNARTSDKIKFVYALKDDIFANEDRTKFFEFIIPVVPIINSSNSLEKIYERLRDIGLLSFINTDFLREVSFYINDMRQLKNIFNEFSIYVAQMNSEKLDKTQLLAMMIYKNVYPGDFEKLHHSNGVLHAICNLKSTLILSLRKSITEDIATRQKALNNAANESFKCTQDLIKLFFGHLVLFTSENVNLRGSVGVFINGETVSFSQLLHWEEFKQLFTQSEINFAVPHPQRPSTFISRSSGKSFRDFEDEVSPEIALSERKLHIDNLQEDTQKRLRAEIRALESQKIDIAALPLYQLIQNTNTSIDKIISDNQLPAPELFSYLITEGYLNENYPLFISNFHEGRLTLQDRDFILAIRSHGNTDPLQPIDNPGEVCASLRSTDFGQRYALNVILIDYLLENTSVNKLKLNDVFSFISRNFERAEEFFNSYFKYGTNINLLTLELSRYWPEYAIESLASNDAPTHISNILSYVDESEIVNDMNETGELANYLNQYGSLVFNSEVGFNGDFSVLKKLNIKFHKLNSLKENRSLMDYVHSENLYQINPDNLRLLLKTYCQANETDIDNANLSTVLNFGTDNLKSYIKLNLQTYLEVVFLHEPKNTEENEKTIEWLINNDELTLDLKRRIITKQEYQFQSLQQIPKELWDYLFTEKKVDICWRNISAYLFHSEDEQEIKAASEFLTSLFLRQHLADELKDNRINIDELGDEASKNLSWFVVNNDALLDVDYEKLIKCLPYYYKVFPGEISDDKAILLARYNKVELNEDTFEFAKNNETLLTHLLAKNIHKYIQSRDVYEVSDAVTEKILEMEEISDTVKLILAVDVAPSTIESSSNLADIYIRLMTLPSVNYGNYSTETLQSVIVSTSDTLKAVTLLSDTIERFDKRAVIEILGMLPKPYKSIASFGRRPKLQNTKENLRLVEKLENNGIISSKVVSKGVIKINTYSNSF